MNIVARVILAVFCGILVFIAVFLFFSLLPLKPTLQFICPILIGVGVGLCVYDNQTRRWNRMHQSQKQQVVINQYFTGDQPTKNTNTTIDHRETEYQDRW